MKTNRNDSYDVIIIGGGPAGLSAALVLGRSRRKVLIIDAGEPRNSVSKAMHGFLSRDGISPGDFLQISRDQLENYPDIRFLEGAVVSLERKDAGFIANLVDGRSFESRMLLFATGMTDEKPKLKRFEEFWGASVHLCPYCDGWEHRDQAIVVYCQQCEGAEFALEMLGWSHNIILCTDGETKLCKKDLDRLHKANIPIIETRIESLEGEASQISGVRFVDGTVHHCDALFFHAPQRQRCDLAQKLGCSLSEDGLTLDCEECASTNIPGVFVAGNTSRGLQLVIMAAAEGTQAAFTINQALLDADCPAN